MISDFISEVKTRGLARVNRFVVTVSLPTTTADEDRLVSLFCENTSLPGMNIATTPHRINGESRELPYERTFETIQLSFYVDSGMAVKAGFDGWMNSVVDPVSRNINYYENYIRNMTIDVLNVEEEIVYTVTLFEAYPKSVSAIQLDNGGKDVMKLSVTIVYKYWEAVYPGSDVGLDTTTTDSINNAIQDPMSAITGAGFEEFLLERLDNHNWV